MPYVIGLVLLVASVLFPEPYLSGYMAMALAVFFLSVQRMAIKIGPFVALFVVYAATRLLLWYPGHPMGYRSFIHWGLIFTALYLLPDIRRTWNWLTPIAAASTLLGLPVVRVNDSMNAAFLVMTLPFVRKFRVAIYLLVLFVVRYRNGGSTAYVLFLVLVLWEFLSSGAWPLAMATAIIGAMWAIGHPHLLSFGERVDFVRGAYLYWREHINPWFGAGINALPQHGDGIKKYLVIHYDQKLSSLHCDWGEILFNMGSIGFVLAVLAYGSLIRGADRETRQALVLVGLCGVSYFPLTIPLTATFAVLLAVQALRNGPSTPDRRSLRDFFGPLASRIRERLGPLFLADERLRTPSRNT